MVHIHIQQNSSSTYITAIHAVDKGGASGLLKLARGLVDGRRPITGCGRRGRESFMHLGKSQKFTQNEAWGDVGVGPGEGFGVNRFAHRDNKSSIRSKAHRSLLAQRT